MRSTRPSGNLRRPNWRHQFVRVKQLMQAFGVPIFEVDGYEADDVIGTLAHQAEAQGIDTINPHPATGTPSS